MAGPQNVPNFISFGQFSKRRLEQLYLKAEAFGKQELEQLFLQGML